MMMENTMSMAMTFKLFDFQKEAKYVFTGYYYGRHEGDHETFKKKMSIPEAVDFFSGFLYADTSISVLDTGYGFEESVSMISDLGCIYAECATTGVVDKIEVELRRIKRMVIG